MLLAQLNSAKTPSFYKFVFFYVCAELILIFGCSHFESVFYDLFFVFFRFSAIDKNSKSNEHADKSVCRRGEKFNRNQRFSMRKKKNEIDEWGNRNQRTICLKRKQIVVFVPIDAIRRALVGWKTAKENECRRTIYRVTFTSVWGNKRKTCTAALSGIYCICDCDTWPSLIIFAEANHFEWRIKRRNENQMRVCRICFFSQ